MKIDLDQWERETKEWQEAVDWTVELYPEAEELCERVLNLIADVRRLRVFQKRQSEKSR